MAGNVIWKRNGAGCGRCAPSRCCGGVLQSSGTPWLERRARFGAFILRDALAFARTPQDEGLGFPMEPRTQSFHPHPEEPAESRRLQGRGPAVSTTRIRDRKGVG